MLGMALCLLAALFAIEAKIAWFAPAGSPMVQVSAAKLQPADAARILAQALSAPSAPALRDVVEIQVVTLLSVTVSLIPVQVSNAAELFAKPVSSPFLFFRPPPAL